MDSNDELYTINYVKAANDQKLLAVTRLLATNMMNNSYINVGKFIQSLSDSDIESLLQSGEEEYENQYEDLIIISEMLASGEGCGEGITAELSHDRLSQMIMFLTIESLHRKGLVKAYHENMSFHDDMANKVVVEKI